jgi:hypothetical protein
MRSFGNPTFAPSPNTAKVLPTPVDITNRFYGRDIQPKARVLSYEDEIGILISGCQSDQTSADAWIHNKYQGACTYYLLETLDKLGSNCTYEELVSGMNQQLDTFGYAQNPELNCKSEYKGLKFLQPLED